MEKIEEKFHDPIVTQLTSIVDMQKYCKLVVEKLLIQRDIDCNVTDQVGDYNVLYFRSKGRFIGRYNINGNFSVEIDFCERKVSVTAFASV